MNKLVVVAAAGILGELLLLFFQFLPELLDVPFQGLVYVMGDTPFAQAAAKYSPYLAGPSLGLLLSIGVFAHYARKTLRKPERPETVAVSDREARD